jgi:imidazolonepropionase-like amidohydrolase
MFVELQTDQLRSDAQDWSAIADLNDQAFLSGDSNLLYRLFEFAVAGNNMPVSQVARLTSINVAAALGIDSHKRGIAIGADADVVVFDAAAQTDHTQGRVIFALQRGEILFYNDEIHSAPGAGMRLPR